MNYLKSGHISFFSDSKFLVFLLFSLEWSSNILLLILPMHLYNLYGSYCWVSFPKFVWLFRVIFFPCFLFLSQSIHSNLLPIFEKIFNVFVSSISWWFRCYVFFSFDSCFPLCLGNAEYCNRFSNVNGSNRVTSRERIMYPSYLVKRWFKDETTYQ